MPSSKTHTRQILDVGSISSLQDKSLILRLPDQAGLMEKTSAATSLSHIGVRALVCLVGRETIRSRSVPEESEGHIKPPQDILTGNRR